MELMDMLMQRRSIRNYTGEEIPGEKLDAVIRAGLLAFSGKGLAPTELMVIRNRETIARLAGMRSGRVGMLKNAGAVIAVLGNADKSDTIIEDSSIVLSNMHLMASQLGLGSCWVQSRLRTADDGRSADDYAREVLAYPDNMKLEAILVLGIPEKVPEARELPDPKGPRVHYENW